MKGRRHRPSPKETAQDTRESTLRRKTNSTLEENKLIVGKGAWLEVVAKD